MEERAAMKEKILTVAIGLANDGFLGPLEARVLREMVTQESPVLMAAFEVRLHQWQ